MYWTLAHPLYDVSDIVKMAQDHFEGEVEGVLSTDPKVFEHQLMMSSVNQLYDKARELLAVCRDKDGKLLGYCWFDRNGYTPYSRDEICNAKFHHVDMTLPVKTRVRLINEMIDQQILWAASWNIPVVCSCSIRGDYEGFMRIHKKRGFTVHGSYAWIRTAKGMELIHGRERKTSHEESASDCYW